MCSSPYVCCSVLQSIYDAFYATRMCVVACVLQCVAVCCSVLKSSHDTFYAARTCVVACVFQCVAV